MVEIRSKNERELEGKRLKILKMLDEIIDYADATFYKLGGTPEELEQIRQELIAKGELSDEA